MMRNGPRVPLTHGLHDNCAYINGAAGGGEEKGRGEGKRGPGYNARVSFALPTNARLPTVIVI